MITYVSALLIAVVCNAKEGCGLHACGHIFQPTVPPTILMLLALNRLVYSPFFLNCLLHFIKIVIVFFIQMSRSKISFIILLPNVTGKLNRVLPIKRTL